MCVRGIAVIDMCLGGIAVIDMCLGGIAVIDMCLRGIDFASFYDLRLWNYSYGVVIFLYILNVHCHGFI